MKDEYKRGKPKEWTKFYAQEKAAQLERRARRIAGQPADFCTRDLVPKRKP